jgi:hypothetical protein
MDPSEVEIKRDPEVICSGPGGQAFRGGDSDKERNDPYESSLAFREDARQSFRLQGEEGSGCRRSCTGRESEQNEV